LLISGARGEGAWAGLEDRGSASHLDRAARPPHPVPRLSLASELSALVCVRLRHHVSAPTAHQRRAEGARMKWPRIRSRRTTAVSPWVSLVAREVEFSRGQPPQIYHAIEQPDYISIVALPRAGKIPIVRQYRPALEAYSWELPAGLVGQGEDPAEGCRRELLEETGFRARAVHALGENSACTGRLNNRIHNFFVEAGGSADGPKPPAGSSVERVSPPQPRGFI